MGGVGLPGNGKETERVEHNTGHDIHFLQRLERASFEQTEMALRLYRDPALVRAILADGEVPPGAERIAIALEPGPAPPHVVVASSGAFVTCLGAGMVPDGLPVVSRERLAIHLGRQDHASRKEQAAREALHARGVKELMGRVHSDRRLTREEFQSLAALELFLHSTYNHALFDTCQRVIETGLRAGRIHRLRGGDEEALRVFWSNQRGLEHLVILASLRGKHGAQWWIDGMREDPRLDLVKTVYLRLMRQQQLPLAFRAMWAIARAGKAALPSLKQSLAEAHGLTKWLCAAASLLCLGHAHRPLRGEIQRLLEGCQPPRSDDEDLAKLMTTWAEAVRATGALLPFSDELRVVSEEWCRRWSSELVGAPADEEPLPFDVAFWVLINTPVDFIAAKAGLDLILQAAPLIANARAEQFYLPAGIEPPMDFGFSVRRAMALAEHWRPSPPVRGQALPGRNQPCPCGSGQKFKRCCGNGPAERPH